MLRVSKTDMVLMAPWLSYFMPESIYQGNNSAGGTFVIHQLAALLF
jgi:hypothetical protein